MGRFKNGLLLGGLLGAVAVWFNATPKGKEMRAQFFAQLEPLYNELKTSMKQLEGPTREMYEALVDRAMEEYDSKKELATDMKMMLTKQLKKKWNQLAKELKRK